MEATERRRAAREREGGARPSMDEDAMVQSHRERAIALALEGRFAESEEAAREALRLRPDDVDTLIELGVAAWGQGRHEEAESIYRHAGRLRPDDHRMATNLGMVLKAQGRRRRGGRLLRAGASARAGGHPRDDEPGRGAVGPRRFRRGFRDARGGIERWPDSTDATHSLAMNRIRQGRWREAATLYERALAYRPESPELHRNLGYALLAMGEFERGWAEHEWRLNCTPHPGCRINRTFWNGDRFPGQTILLHHEQGFGDVLQFLRYVPMVKARGGRVVLLCQQDLVRLVARCEGVDLAFGFTGYAPECHIHAPLLSLPVIFGTTLETIPSRVPYLFADPAVVPHWRSTVAGLRAPDAEDGTRRPFLVGIAWQGRPTHPVDHWRSFPLERLAPLAAVPGVRLVNLQVGDGVEQLAALGGRFAVHEVPGRRGRDFSETAAIIPELDLVIAPDSAIAHLAGGLGAPVWVGARDGRRLALARRPRG